MAGHGSRKAADLKKTPPPPPKRADMFTRYNISPPNDEDYFIDDNEIIMSDTSSILGYASDPVFPRQRKKMAKNKTFKY